MQSKGLDLEGLSDEQLDWLLAEKVVDYYEDSLSSVGLAQASYMVAAFAKAFPRASFSCAFKALDVWRKRHPPAQAAAFPPALALGLATWCLVAGQPGVAASIVLCWGGLLRAGEALTLTRPRLLRSSAGFVVVLGRTKRGMEQKVVINEGDLCRWLDCFLEWRESQPAARDLVCEVSYGKLQYWIARGVSALGMPGGRWSSHGLRRGAASELARQGVPFSDILLRGRWLSERSAREYIRKGEVAALRVQSAVPADRWARITRLAACGPHAWGFL